MPRMCLICSTDSVSRASRSSAPPTVGTSRSRSRRQSRTVLNGWYFWTRPRTSSSLMTPCHVWRREQSLIQTGDLAGATDLMVDTWLGPDADDDHRALLRAMQRRAFELQVAAGDDVTNRDLPVDLGRILMPVTVLVGKHDLPFFRTTARVLADGLPEAELVELPWAGHLPSLERPAETARLVATALR